MDSNNQTPLSQCPGGSIPYIIRQGDTIYNIAQRYDLPMQSILILNPGINPNNLQIGQVLCIPQTAIADCPKGTISHNVRAGDTFYNLARQYQISVEAITAANPNVNPNNLQIGQVLCIPQTAIADCPKGTISHNVRAGDTFYNIARQYQISVDAITAANPNVNPNNLQIGQVLCIPQRQTEQRPESFVTPLKPPMSKTEKLEAEQPSQRYPQEKKSPGPTTILPEVREDIPIRHEKPDVIGLDDIRRETPERKLKHPVTEDKYCLPQSGDENNNFVWILLLVAAFVFLCNPSINKKTKDKCCYTNTRCCRQQSRF